MSKPKLKPCPFCGNKPKLISRKRQVCKWAIVCSDETSDCFIYSGGLDKKQIWKDVITWWRKRQDAIKTWNKRSGKNE